MRQTKSHSKSEHSLECVEGSVCGGLAAAHATATVIISTCQNPPLCSLEDQTRPACVERGGQERATTDSGWLFFGLVGV